MSYSKGTTAAILEFLKQSGPARMTAIKAYVNEQGLNAAGCPTLINYQLELGKVVRIERGLYALGDGVRPRPSEGRTLTGEPSREHEVHIHIHVHIHVKNDTDEPG